MRIRRGGMLAALGAYVLLAWDGRIYWHEARYLHATRSMGLGEILRGGWNPQFGENIDAAATGVFYLAKISFLAALQAWWSLWPAPAGGFGGAAFLSLLLVAAAALLAGPVVQQLTGDATVARGTTALLLISPTLPYLGGKVLAEALALPLALASLAALAHAGNTAGRRRQIVATSLALVLYLLAITARVNISALVVGALVAAAMSSGDVSRRRQAAWLAVTAVGLQAAVVTALLAVTGLGVSGLLRHIADFAGQPRPLAVSGAATLASLGALVPLAFVAAGGGASGAAPGRRALTIWLACTLLPTLAVALFYQVEPRYLVAPLVPLAGLAWIGTARLARLARRPARQRLLAAAILLCSLGVNATALSFLPYEIDSRAMNRLMNSPELTDPGARLLVPWGYSDFHYLIGLWPARAIYLVHVPRRAGQLQPYTAAWSELLRQWYGRRFLAGPEELAAAGGGPTFYLAWDRNPPLQAWSRRLAAWGLPGATALEKLAGVSHGDQSWVVEAPALELRLVRNDGQYRLMQVLEQRQP